MPDEPPAERSRLVTWQDPVRARRKARNLSGAELVEQVRLGEIPQAPFARLIGLEVFDAGEGRFTATLQPQEFHYNPMGSVHGGILSTLLDTVMCAAIHTALPAGRGYVTLGLNINFLSPVSERTGVIMAEGKVVSIKRQVAIAEGTIINVKGDLCATGTATCMLYDLPAGKRAPSDETA